MNKVISQTKNNAKQSNLKQLDFIQQNIFSRFPSSNKMFLFWFLKDQLYPFFIRIPLFCALLYYHYPASMVRFYALHLGITQSVILILQNFDGLNPQPNKEKMPLYNHQGACVLAFFWFCEKLRSSICAEWMKRKHLLTVI